MSPWFPRMWTVMNNTTIHLEIFKLVLIWHYSHYSEMPGFISSIKYCIACDMSWIIMICRLLFSSRFCVIIEIKFTARLWSAHGTVMIIHDLDMNDYGPDMIICLQIYNITIRTKHPCQITPMKSRQVRWKLYAVSSPLQYGYS